MTLFKKYVSGMFGLALIATASQGLAQEQTPATGSSAQNDEPIEEITVMGIRSSLRDAIGIKRSYVGTMDAISAEDFGKFPDGNLAESLARVPGIAIDRSNVEGQKIAVRGFGPEFNLVTLNGRQMPTAPEVWSGGRSFNFGDIASPGVSAVEVFKSANSTLPSGGIGATVNMITTKPLEVDGTRTSVSLGLVEDTTSEAGGMPVELSALFATNQGRWGASLSASYQERTNREEGTRESNWLTVEVMEALEGYNRVTCCWANNGEDIVDNNQRADGMTFYQEPTAYLISDNDRTRTNAQLTFQFDFSDSLRATADYTYSNVDFSVNRVLFGSWLGGWDTIAGTINEHGAYTDVVVGNRAYDHEIQWHDTENENESIGLNLDWQVTPSLGLQFDAHSSSAAVDGGDDNTGRDNVISFTTDIQGQVTHTNGGNSGINSFSYDTEFNPENFVATSVTIRDGYKENELDQFQIKGTWDNEDGFISSIDFGISHIDNDYTKISRQGSYGAQGNSPADYDDSLFVQTGTGGLLDGFGVNIGTSYYYDVDPGAGVAAFMAANPGLVDPIDGTPCCGAGDIESNERVYETLDSAYVQFNMATEIGRMPLDIVAGLRYEESETESISYFPVPTTLRWDMISGLIGVSDGSGSSDLPRYGSSEEYLPSIAFSLGLTDDQVLRLSWGKTMARPDLFQLSSNVSIGNRDFFTPTASGGNPDLDPLLSENFDLSYEFYYRDESYFAVNYFHKDISNFIGSRTVTGQTINGLTDPTQSDIGQFAQNCVRDWVAAGRPDPGFPGEWGSGDCVAQQALWAQGWMNDNQHMGWVALGMTAGLDVSNGYPALDPGVGTVPDFVPPECGDAGWWRCAPGYIDGTSSDPLAMFEVTAPYNMNSGTVDGVEVSWQHLFADVPFGVQFNYTWVNGDDVEVDRDVIGQQFLLPGLGDSGNVSVFFENDKHTARLALNYRGETVVGFANYDQPLFVDEREQLDFSYQFRLNDSTTFFLDAMNINDETTRLYVRESEMLFLSQDHGPVYKFGARLNF